MSDDDFDMSKASLKEREDWFEDDDDEDEDEWECDQVLGGARYIGTARARG